MDDTFLFIFGTLVVAIFKNQLELKNLKIFYIFSFFFLLWPSVYFTISILDETKRTDYPGKEISRLVQNKWDDNFINEIKIVVGDEWYAGNLSYNLYSRPIWYNDLKNKKTPIKDDEGLFTQEIQKFLEKYVQEYMELLSQLDTV